MKKFINKIKNNKGLCITYKIFKTIFTIFLILALCAILLQKFNNMAVGGYRIYSIASGSMKDEYNIGDIIVIKETDASMLKVGDDITYMGSKGNLSGLIITHRIISIRKDNNEYYYVTKGISNEVEDPEISFSQVYGKVVYKTIIFSFIGRLMTNMIYYYAIFTIVGLYVSYQLIKLKFDDMESDDEKEKDKDNS